MAKIQQDILGNTPKVGDTIVFNPSLYKGIVSGVCIGFSKAGLPEIKPDKYDYLGKLNSNGNYTPKTGFVVGKTSLKVC